MIRTIVGWKLVMKIKLFCSLHSRLIRTIVGWKQRYNRNSYPLLSLFDPNHCGMETAIFVSIVLGNTSVWSEPLWDGNTIMGSITTSASIVWSEPLWDGNSPPLLLIAPSPPVWSEPLWDGNVHHSYWIWLQHEFDPNHCGMETWYTFFNVFKRTSRLIRTIVGWKLILAPIRDYTRPVWSEPLWDGNSWYSTILPIPRSCLIRTIVGWKLYYFGQISCVIFGLIRTIVGWKL